MTQTHPSAPRAQKSKRRRGRPRPAPGRPARALAVTAVVLAAVAAAASGYLLYTNEIGSRRAGDEASVQARLDAVERRLAAGAESAAGVDQVDQLRERLAQVEESTATAAAATAAIEAQLHTMRGEIGALQSAARAREVAALREIHGLADAVAQLQLDAAQARNADAWRLAEAEHLLVIANQRLQLGRDAAVARRALALADDILRQLGDPGLAAARGYIAEEIAALAQAAQVDVAGVLHQLAALARAAQALPLAGDALVGAAPAVVADSAAGSTVAAVPDSTVESAAGSGWFAASKILLADLGGLVQVETIDADAPPLPAETRALMRANAALLVEAAGLAFLRGEADIYAERMASAGAWVGAHFAAGDATRDWQARRAALAAARPVVELPDISRSLRALRRAAGR